MMGSSGGGTAAADDLLNLLQVISSPDKYKQALTSLQEQKDLTAKGIVDLDKAKVDFEQYCVGKRAELADLETQTMDRVNAALSALEGAKASNIKVANDLTARAAELDAKSNEISAREAVVTTRSKELVDQAGALKLAQSKLQTDQDAFNKDHDQKLAALSSQGTALDRREAELKELSTMLDNRRTALNSILNAQTAALASLTK